jgi:hypothetical protein
MEEEEPNEEEAAAEETIEGSVRLCLRATPTLQIHINRVIGGHRRGITDNPTRAIANGKGTIIAIASGNKKQLCLSARIPGIVVVAILLMLLCLIKFGVAPVVAVLKKDRKIPLL